MILLIIQALCNNTFKSFQPFENALSFKITRAYHLNWPNVQSSAQLKMHPIYHINYIEHLPAHERSLKHSPSRVNNKDFKVL